MTTQYEGSGKWKIWFESGDSITLSDDEISNIKNHDFEHNCKSETMKEEDGMEGKETM